MGWFSDILGGAAKGIGGIAGTLIGGPLGGAAGTAIGGAIGGIANSFNQDDALAQHKSDLAWSANQAELNRQFQRDERLETQKFNIDMWNMNNEYNSPVEQMKRAQAAGINPNAVFSGGISGLAGSSPVQSSPMSGSQASYGSSLASTMLTSDAMVANLLSQAQLNETKSEREQFGLSWDKLTAPIRLELLEANRDKIVKEIGKMTRDIAHIDFDEKMQQQMFTLMANKNEAEIDVLVKQLEEIGARVRNYDADTKLKGAQQDVAEAQKGLIESETLGQDYENVEKKARAEVANITGFPVDAPITNVMFTLAQEGRLAELADLFMVQGIASGGGLMDQLGRITKALGFAGTQRAFGSEYRGRSDSDNMNLRNRD